MALNYSHRPILSTHISDDKLVSPLRMVNGYSIEGVPEKVNGYSCIWHATIGDSEGPNINCEKDRVDRCSSSESSYKDIVDILPADPFDMDIKTTFTAITGWLEDLEVDYEGYVRSNALVSQDGYDLFAGWNLLWNNALKCQKFPNHVQFKEEPVLGNWSIPSNFNVCESRHLDVHSFPSSVQFNMESELPVKVHQNEQNKSMGIASSPCDFYCQSICNMTDIMDFDHSNSSSGCELQFGEALDCGSNLEGVPHEALAFSLSYLGVKDLLSVEMVCKSLCSIVRSDPLPWITIFIDQPLNERITDDILEKLTNRALGNLQCLSLLECPKITDEGLSRILATNPKITKLSVPGCSRLSIEGLVRNIKAYNLKKEVGGIKNLRIGGFYGITAEHFEELKFLVGVDNHTFGSCPKPHFYHGGNFYLPYDDARALDIEMCPKCEKFRLVYDCPAVGCQVTEGAAQVCRACTLCIARCAQCGRCVNDTEYEETFCLELVCSDCFNQLLQHRDRLDENVVPMDFPEPCDNFSLHG